MEILFAWVACAAAAGNDASGSPPAISSAERGSDGVLVHSVRCEYQSGETKIRVLLPGRMEPQKRYPVLYVLPVEAGDEKRYGVGLEAVRQHDLHNRHSLICVAPTFSHLPWYADHPADPKIRQESYFLKIVVPAVEKRYPAKGERDGRWLLGFSKSGWGAWSLLLRHPEMFGRAAAWDAPLAEAAPGKFGMGLIFGTQANFESYRIEALLRMQGTRLRAKPRLVLTGYGNFRAQHVRIHEEMVRLGIPHVYRDGPRLEHHWSSGWLPEAVELLAGPP
jgi:enterochelin esterase-like enzyme